MRGPYIRTDKMHPLPWRHHVSPRKHTAVLDSKGAVVCGSLISPIWDRKEFCRKRQTHAFIVRIVNGGDR